MLPAAMATTSAAVMSDFASLPTDNAAKRERPVNRRIARGRPRGDNLRIVGKRFATPFQCRACGDFPGAGDDLRLQLLRAQYLRRFGASQWRPLFPRPERLQLSQT